MGPVLQLLRGLFAVIPGRHAESFFESAVKVRQILVADFLRDGKNRGFGGDQQAGSHGRGIDVREGNAAARHLRVGKTLRARDDQRKRGKRAAKRLLFGFRKGFGKCW